jgi:UDP-sugar diphosphatase
MKIDTSNYPPECGITLELCAGIVDKDLPLEEVARIEVLEECGYDIPIPNLERIISYR